MAKYVYNYGKVENEIKWFWKHKKIIITMESIETIPTRKPKKNIK